MQQSIPGVSQLVVTTVVVTLSASFGTLQTGVTSTAAVDASSFSAGRFMTTLWLTEQATVFTEMGTGRNNRLAVSTVNVRLPGTELRSSSNELSNHSSSSRCYQLCLTKATTTGNKLLQRWHQKATSPLPHSRHFLYFATWKLWPPYT